MPGLLNVDASFSSRQELLDLQDYPPNGDPSVDSCSPADSQTHSPIGSAPRSPQSLGADDSSHSGIVTGATSFQGQYNELGATQRGHSPMEVDSDQLCGWGALKPKAIQLFNTPQWVLFFFSVAAFLQGMINNGFINISVTSIEKRFDLSSSQTGLIVSSYDIAACICLAFASYFGGNGHKPRWLGWGVVIMGLGSLVFALPHFTTPPYQVSVLESTDMCSANNTSLFQNKAGGGLSNYLFVFMLGQFLHGIGATPLYTLGVTYLDENVKSSNAPVYIGIFYTVSVLGPSAGLMLGGYFLSLYTETHLSTEMTPASPLWVGAWWIGFILGGTLSFLAAIAILGYPIKLPGSQEAPDLRVSEAHQMKYDTTASDPEFGSSLKDMPRSLLLLLKNPTFMFLCLAGASEGTLIAALSAFMAKILESQFSLSSSEAALIFGYMLIPSTGCGTFFGSYIVKRFKLRCRGCIRLCITCVLVGLLSIFIFLIHCPTVSMAGVTAPYHQLEEHVSEEFRFFNEAPRTPQRQNSSSLDDTLIAQCNANCSCDRQLFNPVCGADGIMYYSPCYAGCTSMNFTQDSRGAQLYTDCSCVVANVSWGHEGVALAGKCGSSCSYMPVFIAICTISMICTTFCIMPALTATLRCVPERQKSFALGIQWILVRTLGAIPGPMIFGFLIDQSCLLWQSGEQGSCHLHQNTDMSRFTFIACVIYKVLATVFFILAGIFYKPPPESPQSSCESTDPGAGDMRDLPIKAPPEDGAILKQQTRL